ncbi:hypothetical protein [Methylocapsa acidiphila]|uniref:hypothetical protein n=1 Tax=Methylocapsa acidiphila TaxID=133552 RepID=UPI0012EC4784|nr:hypothetical protein [Methylocapsa acidiphila]
MTSRRIARGLGMAVAFAAFVSNVLPAGADSLGFNAIPFGLGGAPLSPDEAPESIGVPCMIGAPPWSPPVTAQTLPWPSVWLGHFSGGRPDPVFYGRVDWRDEKVCFASRAQCQAWINELRRAYHRPEGWWTCLLLR